MGYKVANLSEMAVIFAPYFLSLPPSSPLSFGRKMVRTAGEGGGGTEKDKEGECMGGGGERGGHN